MSLVERIKSALPQQRAATVDADRLAGRVDALRRFVQASEGHVAEGQLVRARTVIDRAGERLALSRAHTVVALAGATGSGKSSLFNALSRLQLSRVGVRRPTTGVAHACVWGQEGAGPLLDWLGVPPNRRFTRESALDGDDEARLRGLVLLDLPDFDSIEARHRLEVDRLLRLVDLVVWVLDPQKYADRVVHEQYLAQFRQHRDVTVVVLNQADRLTRADSERIVADLSRLLDADGLEGVPAFATSAKGQPGLEQLRGTLERAVEGRQASLRRLAGDVTAVVEDLQPLVAVETRGERIERAAIERLSASLAVSAGVPIVATATERTYRHRAIGTLGWPVARWARRLRPDPLRRLHLDQPADPALPAPATSLPEATAAQRAAVALASREVAEQAGAGLPEPWPAAVTAASRSRLDDVPDALDLAVASADLGVARRPAWWRLVGALQWLGAAAALVGLVWLAVRALFAFLGLPDLDGPQVGRLPLATALFAGGLLFGLLLAVVVRPFVTIAARRAKARAERRLRAAIADVAATHIVAPVREVLRSYDDARDALASAA